MEIVPDPNIRSMELEDTQDVASVHLRAFSGFFLSFLGARFLQELYSSIVNDPTGIAFVWCEKWEIEGFIAGTEQFGGLYRRLVRHRLWRFALAATKPAIRDPSILPRLFRALKVPKEREPEAGVGTLMSIGVVPDSQGRGIAHSLVKAFLSESAKRGLIAVNLTTDKVNNESVNRFYLELGFRVARTFNTPEGRQMNEFMIYLVH